MHAEPHPLAGKTVVLKEGTTDNARGMVVEGKEYEIEDWWDKLTGSSWMDADDNIAAIQYAIRRAYNTFTVPIDDEVVYGHINGIGHLVHVSELPS